MVTGGFRTRAGMEAALGEGDCDMIGLGRPLCWQPDFPRRLLDRDVDGIERIEDRLNIRRSGWLSPASPIVAIKMLNTFGAMSWYYCQIFRLADGEAPAQNGPWHRVDAGRVPARRTGDRAPHAPGV